MWGVDPAPGPRNDGVIDLTPSDDPSSQVTAPLDRTRRFDPVTRARKEPIDPWSSGGGTLARPSSGAPVSYPPPETVVPATRRSGGPAGCLLGMLAFVIIAAVAGVFAWAIAKPIVNDRVQAELDHGIATQVAAIDVPSLRTAGRITLTEDEINAEIGRFAGSYDPVKNLRFRILPEELRVSFDLYGVTSTYRGGLKVENGRMVVVDPELSGPAGQILDAREIADILETQLASLMDRSDVQPAAVRLREGVLTVTTKRA
ncbi:MAG: hypothetical protein QOF73_1277 [Thermomicrobiales bacterium]|nr:hypothetical protein [Thermomicrobiales bacterium]